MEMNRMPIPGSPLPLLIEGESSPWDWLFLGMACIFRQDYSEDLGKDHGEDLGKDRGKDGVTCSR